MQELWKSVPVCSAYEASSLGRIRRVRAGTRTRIGHVLSLNAPSNRYLSATLVWRGKRTYVAVHSLICELFHGPRPSLRHQAAHLNGNRHDNRADNLAWVLPTENEAHKAIHGTKVQGEKIPGAKLTSDKVREIRAKHANRRSGYAATAAQYGIDPTLVGLIIRGRIWRHVQ
jgi:hypothetical protein